MSEALGAALDDFVFHSADHQGGIRAQCFSTVGFDMIRGLDMRKPLDMERSLKFRTGLPPRGQKQKPTRWSSIFGREE